MTIRLFFLGIFISFNLSAQIFLVPTKKTIGSSFTLSTNTFNPFWARSNQFGIVPLESQYFTAFAAIEKQYDSTFRENKRLRAFDLGYGIETVINTGKVNQVLLPEAYVKLRLEHFQFYAGRRREVLGLTDTLLSSGSFIWSGNALPIPKLEISIPNYVPIVGKGLVSVKGAFSHGWFDRGRPYTRGLKLHQKWFYTRLGRPNWKIQLQAGFNHQAQWGGYSPFYTVDGKLPDGWKNYLSVVTGKRASITGVFATSDFDANRVGNHLGSVDLAMDLNLSESINIQIYRQSIFEDGSLFYLTNISDGLNGLSLSLKNYKLLSKVNFEIMSTKSQGGANFIMHDKAPDELRGSDNYFNNAQIRDGWTYDRNIIGTPLIQIISQNEWIDKDFYHDNNRVKAFHFSFKGELNANLKYLVKQTYSNNLGAYHAPINKNQYSGLIFLNYLFNTNQHLFSSIAYDIGSLYPKSIGIRVGYMQSF